MKKRALCFLILSLTLAALLAACAAKTPAGSGALSNDPSDDASDAADPAGLILSVDPDSVAPTGLTLTVLRTEVGGEWMFGSDYTVETKADDGWEPVPPADPDLNYAFTAEGVTLAPGESTVLPIDWSTLYGALPAGPYRIGKSVTRYPGGRPVTVWAAFEIKP